MKSITVLICLFCLWLGGFVLYVFDADFLGSSASQTISKNSYTSKDAIVVLTGGRKRIKTGFELLAEKKAPKLLISGVSTHQSKDRLMRQARAKRGIKKQQVFIDYKAGTTVENALFSSKWIQKHGIKSIVLVTSTYHMRRSLLEFRSRMPNLEITPYAINPLDPGKTPWSKSKKMVSLYILEYTKYLGAYLKHLISKLLSTVRPYL